MGFGEVTKSAAIDKEGLAGSKRVFVAVIGFGEAARSVQEKCRNFKKVEETFLKHPNDIPRILEAKIDF